MLITKLSRFVSDREANVAIIFALAMVPTIYLAGMGLDYTAAAQETGAAERGGRCGSHCHGRFRQ